MSVWKSLPALGDFVYRSDHVRVFVIARNGS
jgi:hypothetical protein